MVRHFLAITLFQLCLSAFADKVPTELNSYLRWQEGHSLAYMLRNISPAGTARGVVVAATSKTNPDYFFHWVRDSSLILDIVVDQYRANTADKATYASLLADYIDFSRRNQLTPNPSGGLGEPKFNVDGSAFTGAWGRPQNDGPALRAIALSRYADTLLDEGKESFVREKLYDGKLPPQSVIKEDLEYVAHKWQDPCFDLWEEISGHHLYTRMVQRRALLLGAKLAARLGDQGAAGYYQVQAKSLESEILHHWDPKRGLLLPTLDRNGGIDYKNSGIDSAVILAAMHGDAGDGFLGVTDDRMLATFAKQKEAFQRLYTINKNGAPGVAIGRYPEDRYTGYGFGLGNPWVLLTVGFGEFLYRAANAIETRGSVTLTSLNAPFFQSAGAVGKPILGKTISGSELTLVVSRLRASGDEFLARAKFHGDATGRFSEQINRESGFMQGAEDLTWSYGAYLTAVAHRPPRFQR